MNEQNSSMSANRANLRAQPGFMQGMALCGKCVSDTFPKQTILRRDLMWLLETFLLGWRGNCLICSAPHVAMRLQQSSGTTSTACGLDVSPSGVARLRGPDSPEPSLSLELP